METLRFMPFLVFFYRLHHVYLLQLTFHTYKSRSHQMLLQATSLKLSTVLAIFSFPHMHSSIEYLWTLTLLTSNTLHPHPQVCDLSPFLFPGVNTCLLLVCWYPNLNQLIFLHFLTFCIPILSIILSLHMFERNGWVSASINICWHSNKLFIYLIGISVSKYWFF